jgi:hypothetical protein
MPVALGVVACAVTATVFAISARFLVLTWFLAGGLWAWSSILLALLVAVGLVDLQLWESDSEGRYASWLSVLGIRAPDGLPALVGLATHRQTLGPGLAILLIAQLVVLVGGRVQAGWERLGAWTAVLGGVLALIMSMSRTGLIAFLVGLGCAFIVRVRSTRSVVAMTALCTLVVAAPLVGLGLTNTSPGTWAWRLELWRQALAQPGVFAPFGPSAIDPPALGAAHAHNLLVELLTLAGLLGVLSLVLFFACSWAVVAGASPLRASAASGVIAATALIGQFEVPVTGRVTDLGLLYPLSVAVIAFAAAGDGRRRSQKRDESTASIEVKNQIVTGR